MKTKCGSPVNDRHIILIEKILTSQTIVVILNNTKKNKLKIGCHHCAIFEQVTLSGVSKTDPAATYISNLLQPIVIYTSSYLWFIGSLKFTMNF